MIALLSPAKKLDFDSPLCTPEHSQPDFMAHTAELMEITRALSAADLAELMHLSEALATLNYERFQAFSPPFTPQNARPAALFFAGEVYRSLSANTLSEADLHWAQGHVRILSGLYGLLRPLDLIQAYRLEMGTKLPNPRGKNLYAFWRDTLTPALLQLIHAQEHPIVINLASNEYIKALHTKQLGRMITPVFQDVKGGKARVLFMFAKRARGWMARWMIQHRCTTPEPLKAFNTGGYQYIEELSTEDRWVFQRPQPPPAR